MATGLQRSRRLICSHDTTVLVTGGASGLGAATAAHFCELGCMVIVTDLPSDEAAERVATMGAEFLPADVSRSDQVQDLVSTLVKVKCIPRVLVNCAGIAPASRTVTREGPHDVAIFEKTIGVNLIGSFLMASNIANAMTSLDPLEDNERGVIINTASVAAYDGQIGQCAYAASKAAIAGMTLPMARDLASLGIRVCAIAPGIFATPMVTSMPEEVQDALAAQVPFPKRLGKPDEYAALAQHIAENRMLNGEVIRLDGAIRMGPK